MSTKHTYFFGFKCSKKKKRSFCMAFSCTSSFSDAKWELVVGVLKALCNVRWTVRAHDVRCTIYGPHTHGILHRIGWVKSAKIETWKAAKTDRRRAYMRYVFPLPFSSIKSGHRIKSHCINFRMFTNSTCFWSRSFWVHHRYLHAQGIFRFLFLYVVCTKTLCSIYVWNPPIR